MRFAHPHFYDILRNFVCRFIAPSVMAGTGPRLLPISCSECLFGSHIVSCDKTEKVIVIVKKNTWLGKYDKHG